MKINDFEETVFAGKIFREKTRIQKILNWIKNIFRSKNKKQYILKTYFSDDDFHELFITIDKIERGETQNPGIGTFSFKGTVEE